MDIPAGSPSAQRFVCSDCGVENAAAGDCAKCGQGPLVDAAQEDVRQWLLDEDAGRRQRRESRLLGVSIGVTLALFYGIALSGTVKLFGALWSPQGIILTIVVALGLWRLLALVFPAKPRFAHLKRA